MGRARPGATEEVTTCRAFTAEPLTVQHNCQAVVCILVLAIVTFGGQDDCIFSAIGDCATIGGRVESYTDVLENPLPNPSCSVVDGLAPLHESVLKNGFM
jgi:hypothetical protein